MKKIQETINEISAREKSLRELFGRAYEYRALQKKVFFPPEAEYGTQKNGYINENFELKAPEYSFRSFEAWHFSAPIGADSELNVVEDTFFECCEFRNCIFENIIFRDCSFFCNTFDNVRFVNVTFENCRFAELTLAETDETSEWITAGNMFSSCAFWGGFVNHVTNDSLSEKDLENCIFDKCMFYSVNFEKYSLQNTVFDSCVTYRMRMKDCDLRGFSVKDIDRLDISFYDDRGTLVDEETLIDTGTKARKEDFGHNTEFDHYEDTCITKSKTLLRFSRLFGKCGLAAYEGEYFYRSKITELKGLHSKAKVKSFVSLILCGYGERPLHTLFTILGMIFLFGIMYMFTGISTGPAVSDIIMYPSHTGMSFISDMGKCLFFSITNFSTVGYGNYVPVGTLSSVLSAIQMLMGVGLCALWTGCIFRKMSR